MPSSIVNPIYIRDGANRDLAIFEKSGSIEQDADVVGLLVRPEFCETSEKAKQELSGDVCGQNFKLGRLTRPSANSGLLHRTIQPDGLQAYATFGLPRSTLPAYCDEAALSVFCTEELMQTKEPLRQVKRQAVSALLAR